MRERPKTLEGESPLLKDGALSLQTSLTHRELPHKTPAMTRAKILFRFSWWRGSCGEVFVLAWEVRILYMVRLRARLVSGVREVL